MLYEVITPIVAHPAEGRLEQGPRRRPRGEVRRRGYRYGRAPAPPARQGRHRQRERTVTLEVQQEPAADRSDERSHRVGRDDAAPSPR